MRVIFVKEGSKLICFSCWFRAIHPTSDSHKKTSIPETQQVLDIRVMWKRLARFLRDDGEFLLHQAALDLRAFWMARTHAIISRRKGSRISSRTVPLTASGPCQRRCAPSPQDACRSVNLTPSIVVVTCSTCGRMEMVVANNRYGQPSARESPQNVMTFDEKTERWKCQMSCFPS